jgi:predicted metal-dependent hydrolase
LDIRIVASARRRRTVSAAVRSGVLELRVPAWMPEAERQRWADRMRLRIERQQRRAAPSDRRLQRRADELNRRYFDGRLSWASVAFAEQASRWGSCTFTAGVVRISSRAAALPRFVLDYLLMHELAHLEEPGHGAPFWALVNRYPLSERARGYLMALDQAQAGAGTGF